MAEKIDRRYNCWYNNGETCCFGEMPAYKGMKAEAELEGDLCGRVVDPAKYPKCSDCYPVETARHHIQQYIDSLREGLGE